MARYRFPQHWNECWCAGCQEEFEKHNQFKLCACPQCQISRKILSKETPTVATVNFCERCNTMGKSNAMGILQWAPDQAPGKPMSSMEICPGCVADLVAWLDTEGVVFDRPKYYTEPWMAPEKTMMLDDANLDDIVKAYLRGRGITEIPAIEK